ncbi:DUF3298 and DUF4163 domain-containing protein [Sphingomonas sp. Y38-1Y]|uniref:DUF3298 and DUF4163 domain-containing protein n=1 Tax=Sphingomonas sp. Y38-1Y TaxID=3078265 RepID=UPI0028E32AC3|nr:DUF3298 and DUF4163 domain-containing protein [Sphingomonas sp. Y38-1Y]
MRTVTMLGTAMMLAACGGAPEQPAATSANAQGQAPVPPTPPSPPAAAAKASKTTIKNDSYSFDYTYPAKAAAIAPLARWLDGQREEMKVELDKDTAEFRAEAKAGDFPFRAYESTVAWKVVTDTPRLLSLSAETWAYTGGAHGSPGYDAVVWDKAAGERLKPTDLFTSTDAIQTAIGTAFCAEIDKQREERRGEPVVRADDSFNACPKVDEATLILGSTDRQMIDRVGLLVGPYVAGPYAEGVFEVTLPVTPALLSAVKPAYRDLFRAR